MAALRECLHHRLRKHVTRCLSISTFMPSQSQKLIIKNHFCLEKYRDVHAGKSNEIFNNFEVLSNQTHYNAWRTHRSSSFGKKIFKEVSLRIEFWWKCSNDCTKCWINKSILFWLKIFQTYRTQQNVAFCWWLISYCYHLMSSWNL